MTGIFTSSVRHIYPIKASSHGSLFVATESEKRNSLMGGSCLMGGVAKSIGLGVKIWFEVPFCLF